MVLTNRKSKETSYPFTDEGWWESVLAEEERFIPARVTPAVVQPVEKQQPRPRAETVARAVPAVMEESHPQPDWEYAMTVYKQDQIVSMTVNGHNRGGLLVEGARMNGFVPYSHLVDMICESEPERENFLLGYQGRELRLKIIECVPEEGRIVFSERAARADVGRRTQLFSSLQPGQVVRGEVTNITDFGVFVDLGGVEGLIHISELSWGRVIHPAHIINLGEEIEVQVLDVLPERCRIALSLKRLQENPWLTVHQRYAINDVVPATITTVVSFGVFARLEEGLEGLVHVSEMDLPEGETVKDNFQEGQVLHVRILHIDPAHQRLGLSLKVNGL